MGMEFDPTEVQFMFEGAKGVPEKAMEYLALDYWAVSVEKANHDEGDLQSSIQMEGGGNEYTIGTDLYYAPFVHEGTAPHMITSQYWDGYLYWPGADHPVRYVMHPGYEGNPWFDIALDIIEGRLDEYLEMAIGDIG